MLRWLVISAICSLVVGFGIPTLPNMRQFTKGIPALVVGRVNSSFPAMIGKGTNSSITVQIHRNGSYISSQCSSFNYCPKDYKCCSINTCCPNNLSCCGGGSMCCQHSGSPSVKSFVGLTITALLFQLKRIWW